MKEVEKDSDEGDNKKNHNSNDGDDHNGIDDNNKNYYYLSHKKYKIVLIKSSVRTRTCRTYIHTYVSAYTHARAYVPCMENTRAR